MARPSTTAEQFAEVWHRCGGSPRAVADVLGVTERNVHARRERLAKIGLFLETGREAHNANNVSKYWGEQECWSFPRERQVEVPDGNVIVFSDAHYWPTEPSIAHRGLIEVCKALKPRRIVANGDIFDGHKISRHDPHGWARRPSVKEEIAVCQDRMAEIEEAVGRHCEKDWNVGNHDIRFERVLISRVSDYEGLGGFRLADHFPRWEMAWSMDVNRDVIIKHKHNGGIHAGYNNTLKGGRTIVTGHTHILESKPWNDYNGRRWGVQTGTLANLHGPQFEYHENGPSPSCSGFVVLTFRDRELMPPELAEVINGRCIFRGEVVAA